MKNPARLVAAAVPAVLSSSFSSKGSSPLSTSPLAASSLPQALEPDSQGWLGVSCWWSEQGVVRPVGHRLRTLSSPPRAPRYGSTHASGMPRLSAYGALLDVSPWTDPTTPLVLVEGERSASLLAWLVEGPAIAALPGVWSVDDAPPSDLSVASLARQLGSDLKPLVLAGRAVRVLVDRHPTTGRPCPSASMTLLVRQLVRRGAQVHTACPPAGAPVSLLRWLEEVEAGGPLVDPEQLRGWLQAALEAPRGRPPRAWNYPPPFTTRLADRLPRALRQGPAELQIPFPFGLIEQEGAPVGLWSASRWVPLSGAAFWPVAQRGQGAKATLELATVQRRSGRLVGTTFAIERSLLEHPRALYAALGAAGVWLHPRHRRHVPAYLQAFLHANATLLRRPRIGSGARLPLGGER